MPEMRFASSRCGAPQVSLSQAMTQGLAADGGLYVPCEMPTIDAQALPTHLSLPEIARLGLAGFFAADELREQLAAIADAALNIPAPTTPVTRAPDPLFVLELYHGPTAAFKDFGARFLAECQQRQQSAASGQPLTILVATSGDTGGAVAAAF
jgi:threonine synthase